MKEESNKKKTLYEGKCLRLYCEDHWEWVERVKASGVVVLAAVTPEKKLLLVEQYRTPLKAQVIELPAGLAGDKGEKESLEEAAARELFEETGYEAGHLEELIEGPTSSGLTPEQVTFFMATELKKKGEPEGDGSESIVLHEVALAEVDGWLDGKRKQGKIIDFKIYAGLYLLFNRRVNT